MYAAGNVQSSVSFLWHVCIGSSVLLSKVDYTKLRILWMTCHTAEVAWHERRRAWVGDISQRSPRLQGISIREKILRYAYFKTLICLKIYLEMKIIPLSYGVLISVLELHMLDALILVNIKILRMS